MLRCSKCQQLKDISDFWKQSRSARGYAYRCKACADKRIFIGNAREGHYLRRYGVTYTEYETIVKAQQYKCAICHQSETRIINGKICALALDHSHDTNKVRQALCFRCNKLLGSIGDNIKILEQMIVYLKKHS